MSLHKRSSKFQSSTTTALPDLEAVKLLPPTTTILRIAGGGPQFFSRKSEGYQSNLCHFRVLIRLIN